MRKAVIFVDANNWYHNVKHLIKPSDVDIEKLCCLISERNNLEVVEIRWYASMPSRKHDELLYHKQRAFLGHLQKAGVKVITRKLQIISNKKKDNEKRKLVSSWNLCDVCRAIVEKGLLSVFDVRKKEKGIDVWIAVDMVDFSLRDDVDCCILISGDADFIPAFGLVKKNKKDVLSVSVSKGYSSELRQKFPYLVLKRDDLVKCLKEYGK